MTARNQRPKRWMALLAILVALIVAGGISGCDSNDAPDADAAEEDAELAASGNASEPSHVVFSVDTGGAPTDGWPLLVAIGGMDDQEISPAGGTVVDVEAGSHTLAAANRYFIASDGTLLHVADVTPSDTTMGDGETTEASVTLEKVDPSSTERAEYQEHIDSAREYLAKHVGQGRADELGNEAERLLPPENAPPADSGSLTATFIDVGQGDATLLQLPDDKVMLVDAGPSSGASAVTAELREKGIERVDYLVATHPDADHIGGMAAVISSFDIGEIWAPNATNDTRTFEGFLDAVDAKGMTITAGYRGRDVVPDDGSASYSVTTLGPASEAETTNESSLVLQVDYGSTSFLLTGDADASDIASDTSGHEDVLKVSHHGSRTGTTLSLARELTPKIAVISYDEDNSYGHPTQACLDDLSAVGTQVYGTGANGDVTVTSDGTNVFASCEREGTVVSPDSSQSASRPQATSSVAAATPSSSTTAAAPSSTDNTETVYVTPYGKKYHRSGCRYLEKSNGGTAMSKSSAESQGYEACKVCKP